MLDQVEIIAFVSLRDNDIALIIFDFLEASKHGLYIDWRNLHKSFRLQDYLHPAIRCVIETGRVIRPCLRLLRGGRFLCLFLYIGRLFQSQGHIQQFVV